MLNRTLLEKTVQPFGVTVDDAAFARLDTYAECLVETNKQFNLTAITEPNEVTVKHFADCLSLFGAAEIPENAKIMDVGTGAGFPGLVLKLYRPDLDVTFLDSTKKKLGFIETVLSAVSLAGETVHMRAEEAGQKRNTAKNTILSPHAPFRICAIWRNTVCRLSKKAEHFSR